MNKVSVCIPTYNMGNFIGQAISSALAQTYRNIEVIVCDNASTDDTAIVVASFKDARIKYLKNDTNLGAIRNFNRTITESTGEYIKFLEADDFFEPDCIEKMIAYMTKYSNVGMVCCGRTFIDSNNTKIGEHVKPNDEIISGKILYSRVRIKGNEMGTPTDIMLRKSVLNEVGMFDEGYNDYLNDWDLWIRCIEKCDVAFCAEKLVKVRRHPGQIGALGMKGNRDLVAALKMVNKRFGHSPILGQQLLLYLHISEEFIWRDIILFFRVPSFSRVKNIGNILDVIFEYIGLVLVVFLIYLIFHSPFFIYNKIKRAV